MSGVWLGVDLGTTGTRCLAFDAELRTLASAYRENPPDYRPDGRVEQEPESWFETTADAVSEVVSRIGPQAVQGLAVSSQGITIVPVAGDGSALRPAISWLDLRGAEMLPELARHLDPGELFRATGKPWSGAYALPKLMWLARREPEVLQAAKWVLMPMDYLHLRLTGRAVTDHTLASGSMAYRLSEQAWDESFLSLAGVDAGLMPEIAWSGSLVGRLLPEVAQRFGLAQIPVFVGGQDQKCAAHAAGVSPDVTTLSLGTSAAIESLIDDPHQPSCVPSFSYLTPGVWVREAPIATAGASHRWIAGLLSEVPDYSALEAMIKEPLAGDRPLFLPYLSQLGVPGERERWGVEPGGVFWGLGLDTGRAGLARAVVEGVSFEIGRYLRLMADDSRSLRVFGGGARSAGWCQLLADATGRRIEALSSHEAAAAGAAMLAGAPGELAVTAIYDPNPDIGPLNARQENWHRLRDEIMPSDGEQP